MAVTSLDEEDTFPTTFTGSSTHPPMHQQQQQRFPHPQESILADSYLVLGSNIADLPHEDPSLTQDDPFNKFWDKVENLVEHFASSSIASSSTATARGSTLESGRKTFGGHPPPIRQVNQRPPSPSQAFFSSPLQNSSFTPASGSVYSDATQSSAAGFMSYYMVPSARPEPRFVSPLSACVFLICRAV